MLRKVAKLVDWLIGRPYEKGDKVFWTGDSDCKGISKMEHRDVLGYTITEILTGDVVKVERATDRKQFAVSIYNLNHAGR